MALTRRDVLRGMSAAPVLGLGALAAPARADQESDNGENGYWGLGTLVDFSARVPDPVAIKEAGHLGAVRYVSERRPTESWMLAKPVTADEVSGMKEHGLTVTSVYQWGKSQSADWRGGYDGGVDAARRGVELHLAASGPVDGVIYAAIDDDPDRDTFDSLITPYLTGWRDSVGNDRLGVYCNPKTIDWCVAAGLGKYFWQHDWGNPSGAEHAAANLHQLPNSKGNLRVIDDVQCDVSVVLKADYGQWRSTGAKRAEAEEAAEN
ncbi:MAG: DUF1906 domain-containing protein [Segniliparus sp.]|uniref:DUF1906 domain-containing protein n=1 Tax=Segniliparus sp. TaxID=2804064 RepID=UPI003F3C4FE1